MVWGHVGLAVQVNASPTRTFTKKQDVIARPDEAIWAQYGICTNQLQSYPEPLGEKIRWSYGGNTMAAAAPPERRDCGEK